MSGGEQIGYEAPLTPRKGMPGLVADTGQVDVMSRVNAGGQAAKVVDFEFDPDTNGISAADVLGLSLDGVTYSYTAESGDTAADCAAAVAALVNADPVAYAKYEATVASNVVTVTGRELGDDYSTGVVGEVEATVDTAASSGALMPYGALVVADGLGGVKLPASITDGAEIGITSRGTTIRLDRAGAGAGEMVNVLNEGRVWVKVDDTDAVAQRGGVWVDPADPTAFATASGGSGVKITRIKLTGAVDEASGLAVVEIGRG